MKEVVSSIQPAHDVYQSIFQMEPWRYLGQQLVRQHPVTGDPQPVLVEKWEYKSDTEVLLHVRKGVRWHDKAPVNGREFVADDVVFTMQYTSTPKPSFPYRERFTAVTKMETLDTYTVRLTTKQPFAPLIVNLGPAAARPYPEVPREVVDQYGDMTDLSKAVGTGPFMFSSMRKDVSIDLVRNPRFYKAGLPYLDGVQIIAIADQATRIAAYRTGDVDFASNVGTAFTGKERDTMLRTNPNIKFYPTSDTFVLMLTMPIWQAPFNDLKVRQAINLAIDRDEAMKLNSDGFGHLAGPMSGELFPGWAPSEQELRTRPGYRQPKDADIAEAKRLLAEAGFASGLKIQAEINTPCNYLNCNNMLIAKTQLAKAGITVETKEIANPQWFEMENNHTFGFRPRGYGTGLDPDDQMVTRYHSTGGRNYQKFVDPQVDSLLEQQRATLDNQKRKELMRKANERLFEFLPQIWLYVPTRFIGVQPWTKNLEATTYAPYGSAVEEIWLDK